MRAILFALCALLFSPFQGLASSVQKFPLSFRPGERAGILGRFLIQGKEYPMLIDSGASGHGINYTLAQKLKLPLGKVGEGSTPYGDIQTIHVGDIQTQVNGVSLNLRDVITAKNSPGDISLEKDDV